jgi:hypothetical protein
LCASPLPSSGLVVEERLLVRGALAADLGRGDGAGCRRRRPSSGGGLIRRALRVEGEQLADDRVLEERQRGLAGAIVGSTVTASGKRPASIVSVWSSMPRASARSMSAWTTAASEPSCSWIVRGRSEDPAPRGAPDRGAAG